MYQRLATIEQPQLMSLLADSRNSWAPGQPPERYAQPVVCGILPVCASRLTWQVVCFLQKQFRRTTTYSGRLIHGHQLFRPNLQSV